MQTRISFISAGALCAGYLHRPADTSGALPCVVMANGVSGTMDWILPAFAERFVAAGLAVLVFDYRHLGESEGQPRQLIDSVEQLADLRAALAFARAEAGINSESIALWGTSLGGAHVIALAAEDRAVKAVIANMPALDAIRGANLRKKMEASGASWTTMIVATLRLLGAAVADSVKARLGLSPHYIEVYGKAGRALFTDPALRERFAAVARASPTWRNRIAARFLFKLPRYREGTMERIRIPLLICLAEHDTEVSAAFVAAKAAKAPHAKIKVYPAGHFDMYHGPAFERTVVDQASFLARHLRPEAKAPG